MRIGSMVATMLALLLLSSVVEPASVRSAAPASQPGIKSSAQHPNLPSGFA